MKNVSRVIQKYLTTVQSEVNKIIDPNTGQEVQIPDFPLLYEAAGKLDTTPTPDLFMMIIHSLLGRACSFDIDTPNENDKLRFPNDHHLHANMGTEWYWIACHMNVKNKNGESGRVSFMISMQKKRCVGLTAQEEAGWSDNETTIHANIATVTIDMGEGKKCIYRRSPNNQWPLKGGTASFSKPGEDFYFICGSDSLRGSSQVLPLQVVIDDGDNMKIDVSLDCNSHVTRESAFFYQGKPHLTASGGRGITTIPTPGIYYSWPQVVVKSGGTISVGGDTYTVESGNGWIDHQLFMMSLKNANGQYPIPFIEDASPFNAWAWQFFNLDNGHAFTGAAFILGEMVDKLDMHYGYYICPDNKGGWKADFITGKMQMSNPHTFHGCQGEVAIPADRSFEDVKHNLKKLPLSGIAKAWYEDGSFILYPT